MSRTLLVGLLALALPVLAACDSTDDDQTITELVVADAQLSVLESAVIEAGLDGTLGGDGPFTVFAPTDAAFTTLLGDLDVTAAQLLARDDLGAILQYHVLGSERTASSLSVGQTVTTLNGTFRIVSSEGGLGIDTNADGTAEARIISTDIEASNGVVHKIDAVLLP